MPADEAPVAVGMPWQNAGAKASEIGAGMDEIWRFFCRISFSLVTLARQASCALFRCFLCSDTHTEDPGVASWEPRVPSTRCDSHSAEGGRAMVPYAQHRYGCVVVPALLCCRVCWSGRT